MTGKTMDIRDAVQSDAPLLAQIWNDEVDGGTALWTTEKVDVANREQFLKDRAALNCPVFIAEVDGKPAGYSSYGPFRPKDGYDLSVEHSVYVLPEFQGQGIGPVLMQKVIDHARETGRHVMIGAIAAENKGSIRLHERMGFAETGRMPQVGKKFGRWLDLVLMQLTLDEREAP